MNQHDERNLLNSQREFLFKRWESFLDIYKYISLSNYNYKYISVQPMTTPLGKIAFYQPSINNTTLINTIEPSSDVASPKSLLAADCIPCGGMFGKHKLMCPVNRTKK